MEKTIISVVGYKTTMGLGNRIFKLLGDILIAKEFYKNDNILIYFDEDQKTHKVLNHNTKIKHEYKCISYPMTELFDLPFTKISKNHFYKILNNNNPNYIILTHNELQNKKPQITNQKNITGLVNGFPILPHEIQSSKLFQSYEPSFNQTTAFCFNKLPHEFYTKYKKYFNLIQINNTILKEINYFITINNINKNTIGVHIRKGDFEHYNINKLYRGTNTTEKYISEIDKLLLLNYQNIFLSSDDQNIQEELKKIYGKKLSYIETTNNVRDDKIAWKCILILSKCGYMILSHLSSFSEISWWLSDTKLQITYIK